MNKKAKWLLLALALILALNLTSPTLAYYTAIGKATNVVTSGDIQLQIHEKTADGTDFPRDGMTVIPGDTVSKIVTIGNVCAHPFYLRVKLTTGIDGDPSGAPDWLRLDLNTENWTLVEGFYYYNHALKPGQVTQPLFTQVHILGTQVDRELIGSALELTISAYAVQSENNPADQPWLAAGWPTE